MSPTQFPKPRQSNNDEPEEFEPVAPLVEPDQGPASPLVPDDPEHERREPDPGSVERQQATSPRGAKAPLSDTGLALPHERDESTEATAPAPDPVIVKAKHDIDAGLVDTDMHATPGLDAERRERMVPGPGGKPPPSGG